MYDVTRNGLSIPKDFQFSSLAFVGGDVERRNLTCNPDAVMKIMRINGIDTDDAEERGSLYFHATKIVEECYLHHLYRRREPDLNYERFRFAAASNVWTDTQAPFPGSATFRRVDPDTESADLQ